MSGQRSNQASLRNQNYDRALADYMPGSGARGDSYGRKTPSASATSPTNRKVLQRVNSQGAQMKSGSSHAVGNLDGRGPTITKVQADLLFKRYTGHQRQQPQSRTPKQSTAFSSFNDGMKKEMKREQVHGLNRMDLDTFILAIAEIAQALFSQYFDENTGQWINRGPPESLLELVQQNLMVLDNQI